MVRCDSGFAPFIPFNYAQTSMQADSLFAEHHGSLSSAADSTVRPLLAVRGLCCARNDISVFRDLAFTLLPGRILLIEGDNGSGKTSLLRILCGLLEPEAGEVSWRGSDIRDDYRSYLRDICYVGHNDGIKSGLTPPENLAFARDLSASCSCVDPAPVLQRFGLERYDELPARYLSAGQRRRLALSRLLLERKSLWILDEPLTALDEAGRNLLRDMFRDHLAAGGAVLMTSHDPFTGDGLSIERLRLG